MLLLSIVRTGQASSVLLVSDDDIRTHPPRAEKLHPLCLVDAPRLPDLPRLINIHGDNIKFKFKEEGTLVRLRTTYAAGVVIQLWGKQDIRFDAEIWARDYCAH